MPKMLLRGVTLKHATIQNEEGGVFVRLHASASFTKPVCEAMGWLDAKGDPYEIPASIDSAKLDGEINATAVIVTPNGNLAKFEAQFVVNKVSDFQVVRVKDGEAVVRELRFVIRSSEEGVEALIGAYKRKVGEAEAQMKISYEKQGELPLEDEKETKSQAASTGSVASAATMKKSGGSVN